MVSRIRGAPNSKVGELLRMRVIATCMVRSSPESRRAVTSRTRRIARVPLLRCTVRAAISSESGRPSLATTRRVKLCPPAAPMTEVRRATSDSRSSGGSRGASESMASSSSGSYPVIAAQVALTFIGRSPSRTTKPCPRSPMASASNSQNRASRLSRATDRLHPRTRFSTVVNRRVGRYRSAVATRPAKSHTSGHTSSSPASPPPVTSPCIDRIDAKGARDDVAVEAL